MEDSGNSLKDMLSKVFRRKGSEDDNEFEEELIDMIQEGQEQGVIQSDEVELIANIFEFGDKVAKDVMTIRKKIKAIDIHMSLKEALNFMIEEGYSRYPLYEEEIDNIVGILHIKDAMKAYMQDQHQISLKSIAREAYFTHENQNINSLFKEMQTQKIHMAMVLDEYGQTEGVIGMEDILEVIVGDIGKEHEDEDQGIIKTEEESYTILGLTRLDEIKDELGIQFPDEDFETLNGFLLYKLGHLPEEGETIEIDYEGYSFCPQIVDNKMIKQVKVVQL